MVIGEGDKVHVITRRLFPEDVRRHFAGEVKAVDGALVRVEGYVFVFDNARNEWSKRPEKRLRILSLADSGHIVKVIPSEVVLDELRYKLSAEKHLTVSDGRLFSLDINEFGSQR